MEDCPNEEEEKQPPLQPATDEIKDPPSEDELNDEEDSTFKVFYFNPRFNCYCLVQFLIVI